MSTPKTIHPANEFYRTPNPPGMLDVLCYCPTQRIRPHVRYVPIDPAQRAVWERVRGRVLMVFTYPRDNETHKVQV